MDNKPPTDKEIQLMRKVNDALMLMPNKMALSTMTMTLVMLHKREDSKGIVGNILGMIFGLSKNLCEEHQEVFLNELMSEIKNNLIPRIIKDNKPNETSED